MTDRGKERALWLLRLIKRFTQFDFERHNDVLLKAITMIFHCYTYLHMSRLRT